MNNRLFFGFLLFFLFVVPCQAATPFDNFDVAPFDTLLDMGFNPCNLPSAPLSVVLPVSLSGQTVQQNNLVLEPIARDTDMPRRETQNWLSAYALNSRSFSDFINAVGLFERPFFRMAWDNTVTDAFKHIASKLGQGAIPLVWGINQQGYPFIAVRYIVSESKLFDQELSADASCTHIFSLVPVKSSLNWEAKGAGPLMSLCPERMDWLKILIELFTDGLVKLRNDKTKAWVLLRVQT